MERQQILPSRSMMTVVDPQGASRLISSNDVTTTTTKTLAYCWSLRPSLTTITGTSSRLIQKIAAAMRRQLSDDNDDNHNNDNNTTSFSISFVLSSLFQRTQHYFLIFNDHLQLRQRQLYDDDNNDNNDDDNTSFMTTIMMTTPASRLLATSALQQKRIWSSLPNVSEHRHYFYVS